VKLQRSRRVSYKPDHLYAALFKLILELRECAEFCGADWREVCGVREENRPTALDELVEVDIAMCRLRFEVWRYEELDVQAVSENDISIPTEPNRKRGCSAGVARPRRKRGVGCCCLNAKREVAKRIGAIARGAVRKIEAIFVYGWVQ